MRVVLAACAALIGLPLLSVASCAKGGDTTGFHQVGGSETSTSSMGGSPSTTPTTTEPTSTETGTGGTTTTTETGGGGAGGQAMNCTGTATCMGALRIGDINGDDGDDPHVEIKRGNTSAWFTLKIHEDSSSVISYPDLSYAITLASPPGTQFDLYVYEGDGDGAQCVAAPTKGFGMPAKVQSCWTDSVGSDDDRFIIVEVRYVDGGCDDVTQWTLTITGNPCDGDCGNSGC